MKSLNTNDFQKFSSSPPPSAPISYHGAQPVPTGVPVSSRDDFYTDNPRAPIHIQPRIKVGWSTGLCHCFDDVPNCTPSSSHHVASQGGCMTLWCPCVTFGRVAEIVDKVVGQNKDGGLLLYRSKMRQHYMLQESPWNDCLVHCLCECCALCQEYRELKDRGVDKIIGKKGADKTLLSWEFRSRIAYAAARGVEYLHSQGPNVCHGNIRSSNALLTSSYSARISKFGIAQLVSPGHKFNLIPGYRAPEVTNTEQVSQEADVYSFGVLLLEMLTGEAPSVAISKKKGFHLPKWVRLLFQEKPIFDVFDNELPRNKKTEEEMIQILQLASCCTFEYPSKRPSMAAVSNRIKEVCGVEA